MPVDRLNGESKRKFFRMHGCEYYDSFWCRGPDNGCRHCHTVTYCVTTTYSMAVVSCLTEAKCYGSKVNFRFQTGQLNEYTERRELPADVLCMSLSEIPEGELRSRFLTVGLADKTVRIISLDPQDCLAPLRLAFPSGI